VVSKEIICYLEPKEDSRDLVDWVFNTLDSLSPENRSKFRITTFSTRKKLLREIQNQERNRNWDLFKNVILFFPFRDLSDAARHHRCDMVTLGWKMVPWLRVASKLGYNFRENIKIAHSHGTKVAAGLATTADDIRWLFNLGVDQIFTGDVALARSAVDQL
jgi:glycerophosphoryl diester phosphodiesterase